MPSLLDTLDRFNYTSSSIRSLTHSQPPRVHPGPFTAAILDLTLHDLLREADEAEYGLFSYVKESSDTLPEGLQAQGKVGRKEFRGATPLKTKRVAGTNREEEPEVYVEAALKYLDRFQAVKPMPHARTHLETLIDRLNNVRDNLDSLQTSLAEATQTGRVSPKSQVAEEERRITELKSRVLQLRKRREALGINLPGTSKPPLRRPAQRPKISTPPSAVDSPSPAISTLTSESSRPKPKPKSKPNSSAMASGKPRARVIGPPPGSSIPKGSNYASPVSRSSTERDAEDERLFWSGGKPPRIPDNADSLLNEELNIDVDAPMSPPPGMPSSSHGSTTPGNAASKSMDDNFAVAEMNTDDENDDGSGSGSGSGEPTIVVSKFHLEPTSVPTSPSRPHSDLVRPDSQTSQTSAVEPQTPVPSRGIETAAPGSSKTKVRRVRITAEVEHVCAKIWNTIPDLLVPGNNFTSPGKRPPNAKDTIAILQTIAAQPIPDPSSGSSSPSTRSTLSSLLGVETFGPGAGSPHQIMTANVLLFLLTAHNHEMPLTVLKAQLASKTAVPSPGPNAGREAKQSAAAMGASAAQVGTRALYGCVAKKLVKVDRGGGEQIVKFDRA